jgi:hypothetical protein
MATMTISPAMANALGRNALQSLLACGHPDDPKAREYIHMAVTRLNLIERRAVKRIASNLAGDKSLNRQLNRVLRARKTKGVTK